MTDLIPTSALAHLEPRPGGRWTFTRHAQGTFIAVYSTDDGIGVTYNLSSYTTKEQVDTHCDSLIYKFTGAPEVDGEKEYDRPPPSNERQPHDVPMLSPMHIVLQPRAHVVEREAQPNNSPPSMTPAGTFHQGQLGIIPHPQGVAQPCYPLFNGQIPQAGQQCPQGQVAQPGDGCGSEQTQQDPLMGVQPWEIPDVFLPTEDLMIGLHGGNGMFVDGNQNMQESQLFTWEPTWSEMNPMATGQGQAWDMTF